MIDSFSNDVLLCSPQHPAKSSRSDLDLRHLSFGEIYIPPHKLDVQHHVQRIFYFYECYLSGFSSQRFLCVGPDVLFRKSKCRMTFFDVLARQSSQRLPSNYYYIKWYFQMHNFLLDFEIC